MIMGAEDVEDISGTDKIMSFIAKNISKQTYISLMSQYMPCYKACNFPELARRIYKTEYKRAEEAMLKAGLHNGWIQKDRGLNSLAGVNFKPYQN